MKISVIPSDNTVCVDGVGYSGLDLSAIPSNIRAIQWDGTSGEGWLELCDPARPEVVTENVTIHSFAPYQDALEAWEAANTGASEPPPEPSAPTSCTPAQGLIALFALKNITEQDILDAINLIPDPVERYTAQIGYSRATTWERESPTMQAMAGLLGLAEQDLDALFAYAVTAQV